MPLNIKDPKSGITYFQAAKALSTIGFQGVPTDQVTAGQVGATAAYWQNIVTPLKPGDQYQSALLRRWHHRRSSGNVRSLLVDGGGPVGDGFGDETTAFANLDYWGSDFSGTAGHRRHIDRCGRISRSTTMPPSTGANSFFNSQFHSLYAWRSIGSSAYNGHAGDSAQTAVEGCAFDFNYTYSKSLDISSDAERVDEWAALSGNVINSWDPNALRGVSDFDATHQFNANWIVELPFGKGHLLAPNAHGVPER